MRRNHLFNQPRLRLTLLYSSVIGSILLLLGGITHFVMQRAFDRVVDRELHLLSTSLNAKLEVILLEPGRLSAQADRLIPELCMVAQPCQSANLNSALADLVRQDYHLQLLNLQGQPLAAIAEPLDRFPANPNLIASRTVKSANGESYHLHLMSLQTLSGKHWGYLQVGRSVQQLDDYMHNLHLLMLMGVPAAMLLIGWASWKLAGLAMRPIYQSYERMQQFTADVAHELKTPIAASQAVMETALADDNWSVKDSQQTLRSLQRQMQRLNQLVQDLLLLARLDDGAVGLKPKGREFSKGRDFTDRVCLNELVQDLEEELAPLAMAVKVDLACQIQTEQPIILLGNANQLYRLVSNLIANAIDYTNQNGQVVITLMRINHYAVIQIADTGVGIVATDLPHLFDRFYRVHQDRSRQTGGSGLGLAIVQAIVQAHGGTVQVQSELNQGSTFTVRLPLRD